MNLFRKKRIRKNLTLSKIELERELEEFKKIDLKSVSIDELKDRLQYILHGYYMTTIINKKGSVYFRARINDYTPTKKEYDMYILLENLWCPSGDFISKIKIGRLNRSKKSVLYLSNTMETAIREIRPKIGDTVTIVRYIAKDDFEFNQVGVLDLDRINGYQKFREYFNEDVRLYFGNDKYKIDVNNNIRDFVNKYFTAAVKSGEEYKYKITIAISELLQERRNCDGVAYLGVSSFLRDINYAINPHIALNKLKPTDVLTVRVMGDTSQKKFRILHFHKSRKFGEDGMIYYEEFGKKLTKEHKIKWRYSGT